MASSSCSKALKGGQDFDVIVRIDCLSIGHVAPVDASTVVEEHNALLHRVAYVLVQASYFSIFLSLKVRH